MRKSYREFAAAAVLGIAMVAAGVAGAQSNRVPASKDPTAGISTPARGMKDLNIARVGTQDSTLFGGGAAALPDNRVALPTLCELDPAAQGCPGFCDANPSSPLCETDGNPPPVIPPPPPPPEMRFACPCNGMAYHQSGGYMRALYNTNFATLQECEAHRGGDSRYVCDSTVPLYMGPNAVCFSIIERVIREPFQINCEMS